MGKEEYRPHDVRRLVDWEVRPWEVRLHETGRLSHKRLDEVRP